MHDALVALRAVQYCASVLIFGVFAFLVVVAVPLYQGGAPVHAALRSGWRRLVFAALAAQLASALGWLGIEAAAMSGLPVPAAWNRGTLTAVLTETTFGRVWQLRIGLALFVGAASLPALHPARPRRPFLLIGTAASGALLASIAWSGHAIAHEGIAKLIHPAADAVHLLASGGWIGALVPLAALLARGNAAGVDSAAKARAIHAFSALGTVCVAALTLTGIVNASFLLAAPADLVHTAYGRLLTVKLCLLGGVLALAGTNRWVLAPRVARGEDAASRALRGNAMLELAGGIAILIIVAALGVTAPPAHSDHAEAAPTRPH